MRPSFEWVVKSVREKVAIVAISLPGFTVLVHEVEEGETGYWAEVIEMPGCVSQGETLPELLANIQEAMTAIYGSMSSIPDAPLSHFISWPLTETSTA